MSSERFLNEGKLGNLMNLFIRQSEFLHQGYVKQFMMGFTRYDTNVVYNKLSSEHNCGNVYKFEFVFSLSEYSNLEKEKKHFP